MGFLEKIFEIYKDHAEILTLILLAVLIGGGVGGGFWLNSLKESLAEYKSICEARFQLTEERYRSVLTVLASKHEAVTSSFKEFKQEVRDGVSAVAIESAASGLNRSQATTKLKNIELKTKDLLLFINNREFPEDPELQKILSKVEEYRYPPLLSPMKEQEKIKLDKWLIFIAFYCFISVLLLGVIRKIILTDLKVTSNRIKRLFFEEWRVSIDSCMQEIISISNVDYMFFNGAFAKLNTRDREDWIRLKKRLKKSDIIRVFKVGPVHGFIVLRRRLILGIFPRLYP